MRSHTCLGDWGLLLVSNLIWASQFVLVKIVQRQMGPVSATFYPMLLSTLLLVPIVRRERGPRGFGRMPRRDIIQFGVLGVFGQVVAQLFITWGVKLSPASNGALLMLALPVSTAMMAFFLLGERMTPVRWLSPKLDGRIFACAEIALLRLLPRAQAPPSPWRSGACWHVRILIGRS
jgi:drug/metabolite transporter (DMT)-like permease